MELKKFEKRIISFIYQLSENPGFAKRKSLLVEFNVKDAKFDNAIRRLTNLGYIAVLGARETSHEGVSYKLTQKGIEVWEILDKSVFGKIRYNIKNISIFGILGTLVWFLLSLYSEEIKNFIDNLFSSII